MQSQVDPTFYRSPAEAIAAPPEQLAYVAAYDRAGKAKDAMAVIDCDPASETHGQVVGGDLYYDQVSLLTQLGLMPQPSSA